MQMKTIAMALAVGCAMTILTGCGVPQEEHDAKVAELNTAWTEIENLKGTITDKETMLDAEKARIRTARIELDDASQRIKALQVSEAEIKVELADTKSKVVGLESSVSAAKSSTLTAQDRTVEVEGELVALQEDYKKLQTRFDQFEKNMRALDSASAAPKAAPKAKASAKSDAESAMDLLEQMGNQ